MKKRIAVILIISLLTAIVFGCGSNVPTSQTPTITSESSTPSATPTLCPIPTNFETPTPTEVPSPTPTTMVLDGTYIQWTNNESGDTIIISGEKYSYIDVTGYFNSDGKIQIVNSDEIIIADSHYAIFPEGLCAISDSLIANADLGTNTTFAATAVYEFKNNTKLTYIYYENGTYELYTTNNNITNLKTKTGTYIRYGSVIQRDNKKDYIYYDDTHKILYSNFLLKEGTSLVSDTTVTDGIYTLWSGGESRYIIVINGNTYNFIDHYEGGQYSGKIQQINKDELLINDIHLLSYPEGFAAIMDGGMTNVDIGNSQHFSAIIPFSDGQAYFQYNDDGTVQAYYITSDGLELIYSGTYYRSGSIIAQDGMYLYYDSEKKTVYLNFFLNNNYTVEPPALSPSPTPMSTTEPTPTPAPTSTPKPTPTPAPTSTPKPTPTPTNSPTPTKKPPTKQELYMQRKPIVSLSEVTQIAPNSTPEYVQLQGIAKLPVDNELDDEEFMPCTVTINGNTYSTGGSGWWSCDFTLTEGENIITIIATSKYNGLQTSVTYKIHYSNGNVSWE